MIAPTHVTFAEFVYLLLLTTTGVALDVTNALLVALCALLPDIDTAASTAGKLVPFLSTRIERKFGHRTVTHSVACIAALALCLLPLYPSDPDAYICCLTAYASHPFLDTMTVNGVKLFYPFSSLKCVFPLEVNNPHRYRIQTGGRMDKTLAIMFLAGCIPTFLIARQGYERFIRLTQRNIEAAVRDVSELSRNHRVLAQVAAHNMITRELFADTVEVVGALNPQTIVFRDAAGALHTLGKEFQADYVADDVICFPGEPAHAVVQNIDLANQFCFELAPYVDSLESFLFGDLTTGDKVSLPENIRLFTPVTGSGSLIRLNYATYRDIRDYGLDNIFITKGILTAKTIVGGGGSGNAITRMQSPHRYEQFSFSVAADESVAILKRPSDSLAEGEVVARMIVTSAVQEQLALNAAKRVQLRLQEAAALEEFGRRSRAAAEQVRADSARCANDNELARRGYLAASALAASAAALEKSRQSEARIHAGRQALAEKTSYELARLDLDTRRLHRKSASLEREAGLRSPVRGVVVDIRKVRRNDKIQLTFVVKTS